MWAFNQYAVIWQSYALYLLRPFGIFKIRHLEVEISLCLCRSLTHHMCAIRGSLGDEVFLFHLSLIVRDRSIFMGIRDREMNGGQW